MPLVSIDLTEDLLADNVRLVEMLRGFEEPDDGEVDRLRTEIKAVRDELAAARADHKATTERAAAAVRELKSRAEAAERGAKELEAELKELKNRPAPAPAPPPPPPPTEPSPAFGGGDQVELLRYELDRTKEKLAIREAELRWLKKQTSGRA